MRAELRRARKQRAYSHYYEEARKFSSLVSRKLEDAGLHDFVVVTGGGPGIMEAANRGAQDANSRSVGLNISLPHEQEPNPYVSHELCFQFRYFAIRKMHFLLRAKALVAFPGGYGTLDEVFEVLTLIQTGKIAPIPVVLVGRDYWAKAVNFDFLVEEEFIDADDITSFEIVDSGEEAIGVIQEFYGGNPPQ
ncbi:TIGR00730 family Rossman fold protein [Erythrobacter aureus]|uniref:LOG family protein n=1 Tax=Erythrobacter aureus TaxID=2182384 RepID=UPI003A91B385